MERRRSTLRGRVLPGAGLAAAIRPGAHADRRRVRPGHLDAYPHPAARRHRQPTHRHTRAEPAFGASDHLLSLQFDTAARDEARDGAVQIATADLACNRTQAQLGAARGYFVGTDDDADLDILGAWCPGTIEHLLARGAGCWQIQLPHPGGYAIVRAITRGRGIAAAQIRAAPPAADAPREGILHQHPTAGCGGWRGRGRKRRTGRWHTGGRAGCGGRRRQGRGRRWHRRGRGRERRTGRWHAGGRAGCGGRGRERRTGGGHERGRGRERRAGGGSLATDDVDGWPEARRSAFTRLPWVKH